MGIEQLYQDAEETEVDYELRVLTNLDLSLGIIINKYGITFHSWCPAIKEKNDVIWIDGNVLDDLEEIIQKAKQWRDKK